MKLVAYIFEHPLHITTGRPPTFGAGGRGFESGPHHTEGVKHGINNPLADAHIKGGVLGR